MKALIFLAPRFFKICVQTFYLFNVLVSFRIDLRNIIDLYKGEINKDIHLSYLL